MNIIFTDFLMTVVVTRLLARNAGMDHGAPEVGQSEATFLPDKRIELRFTDYNVDFATITPYH